MKKTTGFWTKRLIAGVMTAAFLFGIYQGSTVQAADTAMEINYFKNAPKIDGTVEAGEWGNVAFTVQKGEENIYIYETKGELADFTADIYLGYDETHIYVAAIADYAEHKNETLKTGDLWLGDCMQIQISDTLGRNRNELNFGLNSINNSSMMDHSYSTGKSDMKAGEGKDFYITREGTKTVYEMAIDVTHFSSKMEKLAEGTQIPFSVAFHQSGGAFIEYCDGIVNKKDIALAGILTMGKGVSEGNVSSDDNEISDNAATDDKADSTEKGGINPALIAIPVAIVAIVVVMVVVMSKKKKDDQHEEEKQN